MKKSRSPRHSARPPQWWAWEFLRRQPAYKEAFFKVAALNEEQAVHLDLLGNGLVDESIDLAVVDTLALDFFEHGQFLPSPNACTTVGEYRRQAKKSRIVAQRSARIASFEVNLIVRDQFRLATYYLGGWYDPALDADQHLATIGQGVSWIARQPMMQGLSRIPAYDSVRKKRARLSEQDVKRPSDGRRKLEPYESEYLPFLVGSNGKAFAVGLGDFLPASPSHMQVMVTFDMRVPIAKQIATAEQVLSEHQRELAEAGFVGAPLKRVDDQLLQEYVDILDQRDLGKSFLQIAVESGQLVERPATLTRSVKGSGTVRTPNYIDPNRPLARKGSLTDPWRKKHERALEFRDQNFLALAFME
jgi:hypothetical protein